MARNHANILEESSVTEARIWRTGEDLLIRIQGQDIRGYVALSSHQGKSLMLEFDGILGGHFGGMTVFAEDDGTFRSAFDREAVELLPIE
jgi:hypothetical protein